MTDTSHCRIGKGPLISSLVCENTQTHRKKHHATDRGLPWHQSLPDLEMPFFASVERVNAELFTLTYGAIVRQLLTDLEEVEEVNKQLDQICVDFKETAEVIAKVGLKMFLGVTASVTNWDADGTSCSLILEDNPLVDFVELPDTCQGLYYCNILSGVIRGALEMVSMKTEVTWVRDVLRGDDAFELQVKLLKQVPEEYPYKDDE
ncbi:hypothetical protein F0562_008828 [Nyssa sinensis]|uniref:Trafficking protein particle complex subunit n=1 Tax=Nyssa sinensis TaxID=561372 RepID=A0A5J5A7Q3_9ASTE|nr:hypothetical protein F0562_008828 [Nyssa sinensis]